MKDSFKVIKFDIGELNALRECADQFFVGEEGNPFGEPEYFDDNSDFKANLETAKKKINRACGYR